MTFLFVYNNNCENILQNVKFQSWIFCMNYDLLAMCKAMLKFEYTIVPISVKHV